MAATTALYLKAASAGAAGQPTNTVWSSDWNQIVDTLTGQADPGQITFSGQISSPGAAPSAALQAGNVTSTGRKWAAAWITGIVDGSGTGHMNGRTMLGPSTASTAMTNQEAVVSPPGSPPAQAVGWSLYATKQGGSTFYWVADSYVTYPGGAWQTITDNTPDASLTTAAPATNTTGSPVTLGAGATIPSGQTLAMAGAHISGGPTFDNGLTSNGVLTANANAMLKGRTYFGSSAGVDAGSTNDLQILGGGTTPAAGTIAWGDGSGWKLELVRASDGTLLGFVNDYGDFQAYRTITGQNNALGLAHGTAVTDPTKASFLTYNFSGTNWAGIGGFSDGGVWIRTNNEVELLDANGNPIYSFGTTSGSHMNVDLGGNGVFAGTVQGTQLKSTASTGTAPFSVTSTTPVTNLTPDPIQTGGTIHAEDQAQTGPQWTGTTPSVSVSATNTAATGTAETQTIPSGHSRYILTTINGNGQYFPNTVYAIVNGTNGTTHTTPSSSGAYTYTDTWDLGGGATGSTSASVNVHVTTGASGAGTETDTVTTYGAKRLALVQSAA